MRVEGAVGLEPADLAVACARHGSDQLAVLIDDAQAGVAGLDGDGLPGVAEADLDALAGDLDAAPAGHPPLDGARSRRQRLGSEADSLQPVPLARRNRAGCATRCRPG